MVLYRHPPIRLHGLRRNCPTFTVSNSMLLLEIHILSIYSRGKKLSNSFSPLFHPFMRGCRSNYGVNQIYLMKRSLCNANCNVMNFCKDNMNYLTFITIAFYANLQRPMMIIRNISEFTGSAGLRM